MSEEDQETIPPDRTPEHEAETGGETSEDGSPQTPPERKVVVNDDPQYFDLDPNSANVRPVEKPPPRGGGGPSQPPARPCPPPMSQEQLDHIVKETMDLVELSQKRSNDQKLVNQKLAFMLTCIRDSVQYYTCHLQRFINFLVHSDRLHSEWICDAQSGITCYEDYLLVLKDVPEPMEVNEVVVPVPENQLRQLVDEVVSNLLIGGFCAQSTRELCKAVDDKLDQKMDVTWSTMEPCKTWFELLNKNTEHQDAIRDMLFKVAADLSFLKTGEISESLVLNLEREIESMENSSSSSAG